MRVTAVVLLLAGLAGCSGFPQGKDLEIDQPGELPRRSGLFSGPQGEFVILRAGESPAAGQEAEPARDE